MKVSSWTAVASAFQTVPPGRRVSPQRGRPPSALNMMDASTKEVLKAAANEARGLAMDAIAENNSGYMNIPLADAEIGAILFGSQMIYQTTDPTWINRDRFLLSAGHGSTFLYTWLHLAGYDLPMEELKKHRKLYSMTPGYPEFHGRTPGVEGTTGPIGGGQGIANAVGMAVSEKMAAAIYNTEEHKIFDHHIFVLATDGCFQEGVSAETAAFAAHEKLDNLIVLYDSSDIMLDKMTEYTQSEDLLMRYKAYGWDVDEVGGHNLEAIETAIASAKANNNGRPKLIRCNTVAGQGMKEIEGTYAAFGSAGLRFVANAKRSIGLPEEKWYVSDRTRGFFSQIQQKNAIAYEKWLKTFSAWKEANPDLAQQLKNAMEDHTLSALEMIKRIPPQNVVNSESARVSANKIIQWIAKLVPYYITGAADVTGSTLNYIIDGGNFGSGFDKTYAGKNLYFGKREHGMGCIMNGIAYHGLFKVSGGTFLSLFDYMRVPTRIAALSELQRVSFILTHDSIAYSTEGPLHQPFEAISSLRDVPNLDVYRPADAEETVAAMVSSVTRAEGPTALIFSCTGLSQRNEVDYKKRREGALKGGYVIKKEEVGADLDLIIIATGSEVGKALEVAVDLPGARVVSMPCIEAFERQSAKYSEEVLPVSCTRRIAFEAGTTRGWYKYASEVLGVDGFGLSGANDDVMKELGIMAEDLRARIARIVR